MTEPTTVETFLKIHSVRAPNIMWFLGAGASASAGVATAEQMTWQFKRILYCAAQRVSIRTAEDLSDPLLRKRLQEYFDTRHEYPLAGDPQEYSTYFELAHPSEQDRREIVQNAVKGARPSRGHIALGAQLAMKRGPIVWTTNFDRAVEDAATEVFGSTSSLTVSTFGTADIAMQAINATRWPLLVKLHGDFQSTRLSNTPSEIRTQDARLRKALVEGCKRFGMAVVGYSGRDDSIMEALTEAANESGSFPAGLFWFHRADTALNPKIEKLIELVRSKGGEGSLVPIPSFDELLEETLLLVESVPEAIEKKLRAVRPRMQEAPVNPVKGSWPVIRMNAVEITSYPTIARQFACEIGGTGEVREAIKRTGADCLAIRKQKGVMGFGSDDEIRRAFASFKISEWDLVPLPPHRLLFDSAEMGLLYDALAKGLAKNCPVHVERRHRHHAMVADSSKKSDSPALTRLGKAANGLTGTIGGTAVKWSEGCYFTIQKRFDSLWLILEPTVLAEKPPQDQLRTDEERFTISEFIRERTARRYNKVSNEIFDAWLEVVKGSEESRELRAFDTENGVDARFAVAGRTPPSRRH